MVFKELLKTAIGKALIYFHMSGNSASYCHVSVTLINFRQVYKQKFNLLVGGRFR